jgi:hypothetical protein
MGGETFAVLGDGGNLWWARTAVSAEALRLIRRGVAAIAGDPKRGRIAALSPGLLEIVSAADDGRELIQLGGAPRAATFLADGAIAIAYGDGRMEWREQKDGSWPVVRETVSPVEPAELIAEGPWLGIRGPRGALAVVDGEGRLSALGRLPANPSAVALLSDKEAVSLEWDTDSASVVPLASPPADDAVSDALRLIAMRGGADPIQPATAMGPSGDAEDDNGCADELGRRLAWAEAKLAGDAGTSSPSASGCEHVTNDRRALVTAETLASRRGLDPVAAERQLSVLLRSAAAGDRIGLRLLGAFMARAAAERADFDQGELARDALRFGAAFPPTFLRAVAAGGRIGADILEAARAHAGFDPTAMQVTAHWDERRIGDFDALTQALFVFAAAERLYAESGRAADARFAGERRAALARILPDARVLEVWSKLQEGRPEGQDFGNIAEAAEPPADPMQRGAENRAIVETLARRFPASPLVDALRMEVRRAEVAALAESDPAAAADLLLSLGETSTGDAVWSPDFAADYLRLGEELSGAGDPDRAFRLAVAALKEIGRALKTPIHGDRAAAELFVRASNLFATTAEGAKPNVVAEAAGIDLSLAAYRYATLPADADGATALSVLGAAARVAAVLANGDDAMLWNGRRAEALFWQGVLVNSRDPAGALALLNTSIDLLREAVEADPRNPDLRFRHAEVLRWTGLIAPSDADTLATEREALGQYRALWAMRPRLERGMLKQVAMGYGFTIANLAQTTRETNLAGEAGERSAEEHAGWVLDALALAAEEQSLTRALDGLGIAPADMGFGDGRRRMDLYGWSIGFLSGLVHAGAGEGATECDRLASDPYDARRRAPGVDVESIDRREAAGACRQVRERDRDDARAAYELARLLAVDARRDEISLSLAREAAGKGVASAFALVAQKLEARGDPRSAEAYLGASQRVVIESFPILYPFLRERAATDEQRTGLEWYAGRAAALGVPEAHAALARSAADPAQAKAHLSRAAQPHRGEDVAAAAVLPISGNPTIDTAGANAPLWSMEPLVELPDVGSL